MSLNNKVTRTTGFGQPEKQGYVHRYAQLSDEEIYALDNSYEYEPEQYEEAEETEGREFSEAERDHLYNMVGGSDNYTTLLEFARDYLPDEFVEQFDSIIQSGDFDQSQEAVNTLLEAYQNWDGEEYEDVSEDMDELADAIYEQFGGQESYTSMLQWAAENKSQEFINAYDSAMSSGDWE